MILLFTIENVILILTTMLSGLVAGLFYAYSCSVNIGLRRLTDIEYLNAMQSINRAILNPWFFASFIGLLLMLPLSIGLNYDQSFYRFYSILIAGAIYFLAVFGVTIFGNVPLNEALDKFNIEKASKDELAGQRSAFEGNWNRLHAVRTVASVLSFLLLIISCVL